MRRIHISDINTLDILRIKILNGLVLFLCCFIPSKTMRKKIRKCLSLDPYLYYTPPTTMFSSNPPALYNNKGEKLQVFFISSEYYAGGGQKIYWDMHNIGLPVHFYQDDCCTNIMGNPTKKYAWLVEPPPIKPTINESFEYKGLHKDFDLVLTHNDKLLDKIPNARLLPYWSVWYGKEVRGNKKDNVRTDEDLWCFKDKDISMMCSYKILTPLHQIRHEITHRAQQSGKIDVFGKFNGGAEVLFKSISLEKYRFSIVVENHLSSYYFTEKILDCFASMTIPLYLGASKIGDFFNTDGIIFIDKTTNLNEIIKFCTKEEYESRLEAIKDNYHRIVKYMDRTQENLLEIINKG